MDNLTKEIKNRDGSMDTVMISSNDNNTVKIGSNYKLVKFYNNKSFKDSVLGADIGIHNSGFVSMAIISTIIAISVVVLMYLNFRI